ncbi:hypothetical protein ACI65C_005425 [Semiaphis heraclei]
MSIIMDTSTDIAQTDQLVMVARYCDNEGYIRENLITVSPVEDATEKDALWSKFKSDFKESKSIVKEMPIFQFDKMSCVKNKTNELPPDSFKAIFNWLLEIDMIQLKE